MKKTSYILSLLIALLSIFPTYADSTKSVEFAIDSDEDIIVEDSADIHKEQHVDSTEFDKAFEAPKKKRPRDWKASRNSKKVSRTKRQKKKSVVADKKQVQKVPSKPSKKKSVKAKAKKGKVAQKDDSYWNKLVREVKIGYKKARVKASEWKDRAADYLKNLNKK